MDTYTTITTFERHGLRFSVGLAYDDSMGPPWEEHDGHGVVSEWTTRQKLPGERVLAESRSGNSRRYYDVKASMAVAKRDGWGIDPERRANLEAAKGGALSPREVAAAAIEADFDRLRGWCDDRWHWCVVVVTLLDTDGEPTWERAYLGGVESDADELYVRDLAFELADEIASRIGTADSITRGAKTVRIR